MENSKLEKISKIKIPLDNVIVLSRTNCQHFFSHQEVVAILVRPKTKDLKWSKDEIYPAMVISGKAFGEPVTLMFESDKKCKITTMKGGDVLCYRGDWGSIEYYPNFVHTTKIDTNNQTVADVYKEIEALNGRFATEAYAKYMKEDAEKRANIEAERYINKVFDEIREIVEE